MTCNAVFASTFNSSSKFTAAKPRRRIAAPLAESGPISNDRQQVGDANLAIAAGRRSDIGWAIGGRWVARSPRFENGQQILHVDRTIAGDIAHNRRADGDPLLSALAIRAAIARPATPSAALRPQTDVIGTVGRTLGKDHEN